VSDFRSRFQPELAELIRQRTNAASGFVPLLGLVIEEFGPGTVRARLPYKSDLDNSVGTVHGGALASLVDHTLSLAVYPLVEPGSWVATTSMNIHYTAPVRSGDCIAEGRVVSLGKRQAVVHVEVTNEGRVVAAGLGGLTVRDRPS
jgi:uncharacterized protein (TIGR00369 family)